MYEAFAAPAIGGCDGAAIGPEPDPHPLGLAPGDLEYFDYPGPVTETDPAVVGVWTTLVDNAGHLPIHSIHRPTGKFLQFGSHQTGGSTADKAVWYPPAPCSPFEIGIENCETSFDIVPGTPETESHVEVWQAGGDPDMTDFSLFCAGHVNLPPWDVAELSEPRAMTVGGSLPTDVNFGVPGAFMFSESFADTGVPTNEDYAWVQLDDLSNYRWYPGTTVLADGSIAVPGGTLNNQGTLYCKQSAEQLQQYGAACACDPLDPQDFFTMHGVCTPEGFCDPDAEPTGDLGFDPCVNQGGSTPGLDVGTRTSQDVVQWQPYPIGSQFGSYPQLFVLPDLPHFATAGTHLGGTLVDVGSETSWAPGSGALVWDPSAPQDEQAEMGGPSCTRGSSAVMYAADKIMKFGGQAGSSSSRLTEVLDLSGECPEWRRPIGGELGMPRRFSSGVLLPDGRTLALGGTVRGNLGDVDMEPNDGIDDRDYAAFTVERFDPGSESWCRLADLPSVDPTQPPVYRGYHSQAFLLPDGRVYLGSGGEGGGAPLEHYDYHLYAPPYLFWGARPQVAPDPGEVVVNDIAVMTTGTGTFRLSTDESVPIERVALVKLSASTHQFDQEQRFVELDIVGNGPGYVDVAPPPSTCYATPGYYMLFALSAGYFDAQTQTSVRPGIPSVAFYVAVTGSCAAADMPAGVPILPPPPPVAANDLLSSGARGLRVSCGGEGSTLEFDDLRQSLLDLCTASGACPSSGTIEIEARLRSTTGQASVAPMELLDTAAMVLRDGVPVFGDPLVLDVAGTEFNSSIDLGPGDHVLELCGTLDLLSACIDQPLRIEPVLAGDDAGPYRAGSIEPRPLVLDRLLQSAGLPLSDDGVAEVALPEGFVFPFYGRQVRNLWVGANGAVRIDSGSVPPTNGTLPLSGAPHIAVYWDDLDPSLGGRVRTYYDGVRFVVAWENVPAASGGTVSAQLHLFASGRIELHYPHTGGGPSPHGASATIGIQYEGAALLLSHNDRALLSADRAFAIDAGSCVASPLRLLDSTPCTDRVATTAMDVGICAGHAPVTLTVPPVPTVCAQHADTLVTGEVLLGGAPQPVASDGTVQLYVGDYAVRWTMRTSELLGETTMLLPTGEVASQPLNVRLSDDASMCCRADQAAVVLTSRDDAFTPRTHQAYCVAAQAGNDDVQLYEYDDTLLGHGGRDVLHAGAGDDVLLGGLGDDDLWGEDGHDVLLGGDGRDLLEGGSGDDELWGGADADALYGGDGSDVLLPGPEADVADARGGDDQLVVLDLCEIAAGDVLDGGDGLDTLWLPAGVTLTDITALGATVTAVESVQTLEGGMWGEAECTLDP